MKKTDAIKECQRDHELYGGQWHVVKLGPTDDDYWSVHSAWVKSNDEDPRYTIGEIETYDFPMKRSVVRTIITYFNKFLLWLFRRFIDARANNRKT